LPSGVAIGGNDCADIRGKSTGLIITNDGCSSAGKAVILDIGGDRMKNSFGLEVFSPAMKAKLDPRYRRRLQEDYRPEISAFWREVDRSESKTALPFTTKTRAYGTYNWRKQ
jgi:hypothetical protein